MNGLWTTLDQYKHVQPLHISDDPIMQYIQQYAFSNTLKQMSCVFLAQRTQKPTVSNSVGEGFGEKSQGHEVPSIKALIAQLA